MCGIAGLYAFGGASAADTERLVVAMRDAVAHRGPDGVGAWIGEGGRVGLGFRRLAIVDLSDRANQPLANEDGTVRVVFNGEIYNHAALRRELEGTGRHRFATDHADSEVIVHAFEEWGIECLQRLRGMFAIAVWDGRDERLWLARDRLGLKPLYYTLRDGRIAFASEIKALLEDDGLPRAVDEEALYHYLTFLAAPPPRTLFRGISKLPAASWLSIDRSGAVREERYWDVWDHVEPLVGLSDDEIAERLLEGLRESVRLRKMSDVPVGVFLSGGIDSSATAALFAEGEERPVRTFAVGYDVEGNGNHARWSSGSESYQNEFVWARMMAERIGAEHHERRMGLAEITEFLPRMIRLQDEPIGDAVCVPLYYVSELARQQGTIVCQAGEGADELFCGYPSWRLLHRLQRIDEAPVPAALKRGGMAALRVVGRGTGHSYEYLRRGADDLPIFWGGAHGFTEARKQRLLSSDVRRRLAGLDSWDVLAPIHRRFQESAWEPSHLNWMSYVDITFRLPEILLMRLDKMSMAVGLEARAPFLDQEFVALALGIPEQARLRDGELKAILKRAVRGLIPDALIDRRKQGFGVPLDDWFRSVLLQTAKRDVADFCDASGLFDRDEALRLVAERGREGWYVLNVALWWKEFVAA